MFEYCHFIELNTYRRSDNNFSLICSNVGRSETEKFSFIQMCTSAQVLLQGVQNSIVFQSFVFYPWQKKETKNNETQRRTMSLTFRYKNVLANFFYVEPFVLLPFFFKCNAMQCSIKIIIELKITIRTYIQAELKNHISNTWQFLQYYI